MMLPTSYSLVCSLVREHLGQDPVLNKEVRMRKGRLSGAE